MNIHNCQMIKLVTIMASLQLMIKTVMLMFYICLLNLFCEKVTISYTSTDIILLWIWHMSGVVAWVLICT